MAIAFAALGVVTDTNNNATFSTAATYTPTANSLVLAAVTHSDTAPEGACTSFAGNGGTWVRIGEVAFDTIASNVNRVCLYRTMVASPTNTIGTLTLPDAGTGAHIRVVEFTGVDTSGTNGSGAVVQVVTNVADATANPNVNLAALDASGNNAVFVTIGRDVASSNAIAPEASWTEDLEHSRSTPACGQWTGYRLATTDNTVTTTAVAADWGIIAVEIKAAAAGVNASVTPDTVITTTTVPTPTVTADANLTTTTVAGSTTFAGGTVAGDANLTPTQVTAQVGIDLPSIDVGSPDATVSLVTVIATTSIQVVAATDAALTLSTVAGSTALDTPSVTGTASPTPTTVSCTTTVSSPVVEGTAESAPSTVSAVGTVPTPTVSATASPTITLTTVIGSTTIEGVSVSIAGSASVTPTTVGALTTVPGVSAAAHIGLTVGDISLAASIDSPSTSANTDIVLETITAQAEVPLPNAFVGEPGFPVDDPNAEWVSLEAQLVMVGAEARATLNGSEGSAREGSTEGRASW